MKNTSENYHRVSKAITDALTKAQAFKASNPEALIRWTHNEIMTAIYPIVTAPDSGPDSSEIIRRGAEIARVFRLKKSLKTGYYLTAIGPSSEVGVFNTARQLTQ